MNWIVVGETIKSLDWIINYTCYNTPSPLQLHVIPNILNTSSKNVVEIYLKRFSNRVRSKWNIHWEKNSWPHQHYRYFLILIVFFSPCFVLNWFSILLGMRACMSFFGSIRLYINRIILNVKRLQLTIVTFRLTMKNEG